MLTFLDLDSNDLKSIDLNVLRPLNGLEKLHLSENVIREIANNHLKTNTNLKRITLKNCSITTIHIKAFSALTNLEELFLGNNLLTELPCCLFTGNPKLNGLKLNHNRIRSIHKEAFAKNSELREINLDSNKLFELPEDVFKNNHNLLKLVLSYNNLQDLGAEMFKDLRQLNMLELQYNKIKKFRDYLFRDNWEIEKLNISHNQIEEIPDYALSGLQNLHVMALSGNPILDIGHLLCGYSCMHEPQLSLWNFTIKGSHRIQKLRTYTKTNLVISHLRIENEDVVAKAIHCEIENVTCSADPITVLLDLSHNKITTIQCPAQLAELHFLNLSHNHFAALDSSWFVSLSKLEQFDITDNGVQLHLINRMEGTIYLRNNPIAWSWSTYQITELFPLLQKISMNNISIYCPLLETIFVKFIRQNVSIVNYKMDLVPHEDTVDGIE